PSLPQAQIAAVLEAVAPLTLLGDAGPVSRGRAVYTDGPAGIAAMYTTSGSTGEPKIVALPHRAILFDIGRQTNDLCLGPDDRFDSLFSSAFSASLATIFGALLNGAELHHRDPRHQLTDLHDWLADRCITISTMTVSMLRHVCMAKRTRPGCPGLRLLSASGEALKARDVEAFRSVFGPSCVLQNAMASTETRTYAQYFVRASEAVESPVPIGWPVAGKIVTLVDESGAPVPQGGEGEIVVRSRYIALGYANDARRTAEKFEPQPDGTVEYRTGDRGRFRADGCLVFLGRTDSQAKIRGHRIELGAVAQAIEAHPAVRNSAVVKGEDAAGNDRLVAYVAPVEGAAVPETSLREFLRERLPAYAVPSSFVFLPELPLNANFKVDLRRLPAPPAPAAGPAVPPSGSTLDVLREIWKEVLQRSDFTDRDRFEELGGDSLGAVRVLVAIGERLGCNLPADYIRRYPSLRELADCVDHVSKEGHRPDASVVLQPGGDGCPFFFVAGMSGSVGDYHSVAAGLAGQHPAYGLIPASTDLQGTPVSVESMAARYAAEVRRIVPAGGRVILVGYSFGGTIAFEVARQLRTTGDIDPLPVVIDMPALNAPGHSRRSARRKMLDALRNLPARAAYEASHFDSRKFLLRARGNLDRIRRALRGRPAAAELDPRIYCGQQALPEAWQAFLNAMYRAMLAYVPARYEGAMLLLRTQVPTLWRTTDPQMSWQNLVAGGVDVRPIPGVHGDCLSEAYASEVTRALRDCAARFDAGKS
ncbi:MAG TPA: AMP-binding protein, partial [Bryobacteraceae bacterium]|nr:AMP-binding protein [Bryobacteraceae bacterium]